MFKVLIIKSFAMSRGNNAILPISLKSHSLSRPLMLLAGLNQRFEPPPPKVAIDEKARAEAVRQLKAVTSVLGFEKGQMYHEPKYDEKFVEKFVNYFDRPEIDGWEMRRAFQDLTDYDCAPDPEIVKAALRACRRLNDYALAIRLLEIVKLKCGSYLKTIWPYMMQEIQPTLDELGIETLEQLGYDKPEQWVDDPDDCVIETRPGYPDYQQPKLQQ